MFDDLREQFSVMEQSLRYMRLSRRQMLILAAQQVWRDMSLVQHILACGVAFAVCYFTWSKVFPAFRQTKNSSYMGMPRLGSPRQYKDSFAGLIEEAARERSDEPYVITPGGFDWVIYPSQVWDEVKALPESVASLRDFHHTVFHGRWTRFGQESDALLKTISTDYARGAVKKVHERQEDTSRALRRFVGRCDKWTEVELYMTLFDITTNTSSCSFVGRELGNTSAWINANKRFPISVMISCFIVGALPRWLAALLSPLLFLPTMKAHRDAMHLLEPVLADDKLQYEQSGGGRDIYPAAAGQKLPITGWLLSRSRQAPTTSQLVTDYLLLSLEATSTQSTLAFSTLSELALRPELVQTLREEICEFSQDGKLPLSNLEELRILDSVIRESIRVNPFGLFSLVRRLKKPVQLSVGPQLPAGAMIGCDLYGTSLSDALWEDAHVFKPYRFLELRDQPGKGANYALSSVGNRWSLFGDGNQACPGRTVGASSLKILIACIIMNYDIKLRPGEGKPKRNALPNGTFAPDLKSAFLFKSRREPW